MIKEKKPASVYSPSKRNIRQSTPASAYQAARLCRDGETAAAGIRNAVWRGRMEGDPGRSLSDGAHNEGGIRACLRARRQRWQRAEEKSQGKMVGFFCWFAAVSDKNYESMLETLMRKLKPDRLVLTHLYTSRALPMEAMEKAAHRVAEGCEVQSIPDVKTAYH